MHDCTVARSSGPSDADDRSCCHVVHCDDGTDADAVGDAHPPSVCDVSAADAVVGDAFASSFAFGDALDSWQ